jgi:hypothetical protein
VKLFGKDVTTKKLLDVVKERLGARGLLPPSENAGIEEGIEAPIDAFAFAVESLTEHVDVTRGLPIETHRGGLSGTAVVLAKRAFRRVGQIFINEALARQVVFNGHALDGYSHLAAEVVRLRSKVTALEAQVANADVIRKQPLLEAPKRDAKPPTSKSMTVKRPRAAKIR